MDVSNPTQSLVLREGENRDWQFLKMHAFRWRFSWRNDGRSEWYRTCILFNRTGSG